MLCHTVPCPWTCLPSLVLPGCCRKGSETSVASHVTKTTQSTSCQLLLPPPVSSAQPKGSALLFLWHFLLLFLNLLSMNSVLEYSHLAELKSSPVGSAWPKSQPGILGWHILVGHREPGWSAR